MLKGCTKKGHEYAEKQYCLRECNLTFKAEIMPEKKIESNQNNNERKKFIQSKTFTKKSEAENTRNYKACGIAGADKHISIAFHRKGPSERKERHYRARYSAEQNFNRRYGKRPAAVNS